MKNAVLIMLATIVMLGSCYRSADKSDIIQIRDGWKFATGDDPARAEPGFNDSDWDTLTARLFWERQGYRGYNGYAWYRKTVFIPSYLKKNSFFGDSLQFILGIIDDTDQTFLNGKPLGSNGITVSDPGEGFEMEFEGDPLAYQYYRIYKLAVDDPRILWDQNNTLAIRVHDHGGNGGIFNPSPSISMVDLKEFIAMDYSREPFRLSEGNYEKDLFIRNDLAENLTGDLTIRVVSIEDDSEVFLNTEMITLPAGEEIFYGYSFNAPQNQSYRVEYSFLAEDAINAVRTSQLAPYILTPPEKPEPSLNGPEVYGASPGAPLLYKVPVSGIRPLIYTAVGLPAGLKLDQDKGIISGTTYRSGSYEVMLYAENSLGKDSMLWYLEIGDKIALTPPLGWNSWNVWGLTVDDRKVRDAALAMKETGLIDYGWTYVNIDDGWEAEERTPWGELFSNEKFPDMKALSNYIHDMGLKIGIYSSPGPTTCGGYLGSYQHEFQDARTWAGWGIDFLKHDWCSYRTIAVDNSIEELQKPYKVMRQALDRVNRDIVYSLCQYGMGEVWKWGKEVGGDMWRTTGDIVDTWESMSEIGFNEYRSSAYAEPGYWNDVDMMVVGYVGWGPNVHPTRLTPDEQYTHISLWTLLASPMLLGCDMTKLDDFTLSLLKNREVLAIHQDRLGDQADRVYVKDQVQVWVKELFNGDKAVGIFNLSDNYKNIELSFSDLNLSGSYQLRDVWKQEDLGRIEDMIKVGIPSHGVKVFRISE